MNVKCTEMQCHEERMGITKVVENKIKVERNKGRRRTGIQTPGTAYMRCYRRAIQARNVWKYQTHVTAQTTKFSRTP